MKSIGAAIIVLVTTFIAYSQSDEPKTTVNFGFGVGLDYGGIGARVSLLALTNQFEIIGGVGYNLAGVG